MTQISAYLPVNYSNEPMTTITLSYHGRIVRYRCNCAAKNPKQALTTEYRNYSPGVARALSIPEAPGGSYIFTRSPTFHSRKIARVTRRVLASSRHRRHRSNLRVDARIGAEIALRRVICGCRDVGRFHSTDSRSIKSYFP